MNVSVNRIMVLIRAFTTASDRKTIIPESGNVRALLLVLHYYPQTKFRIQIHKISKAERQFQPLFVNIYYP